MRGPSEWTVGERELFAAFVSRLNQCQFCANAHAAVAAIAFDETLTQRVLDDFESAPIDAKLTETLRFLRKMTLEPRTLAPNDARAVC